TTPAPARPPWRRRGASSPAWWARRSQRPWPWTIPGNWWPTNSRTVTMSTPSPAIRAAIVIAAVLLLVAALFAVRVGLADLDHFRAKKLASGWDASEAPPSPDEVLRAEAAIEASLRHWRADPDALTLAAQIHGWKGYVLAGNDPESL